MARELDWAVFEKAVEITASAVRGAMGGDVRARIVETDELDVGHAVQMTQVGGVPQRVPVAHLDGGDARAAAGATVAAPVGRRHRHSSTLAVFW